jgi:hypothetical protein
MHQPFFCGTTNHTWNPIELKYFSLLVLKTHGRASLRLPTTYYRFL